MPVENHSPAAAYATKNNILVPEYGKDPSLAGGLDDLAYADIAEFYRLTVTARTLVTNAKAAVDAAKAQEDTTDGVVQADGTAAAGTKTSSTAAKAAVDAAKVAMDALNTAFGRGTTITKAA